MMSDGAHLGVRADEAMKTIIGGEQSPEPEPLSDEAFERMIREAPLSGDLSYEGGANAAARLVLEAYELYPMLREVGEGMYLAGLDGKVDWENPIIVQRDLYDILKDIYPEHREAVFRGLTGFMWGWAVNAARKILGLGPMPNPALLTLSWGETEEEQ